MKLSNQEVESLAVRFCTSVSTLRRIQRAGLDPRDPADLAKWLLTKQQANPATAAAVAQELEKSSK